MYLNGWMNDYYHCHFNGVKTGTDRAKATYPESHNQLEETGLELSSSTFLSRNLAAATQLHEGGHSDSLLGIRKSQRPIKFGVFEGRPTTRKEGQETSGEGVFHIRN